MRSFPVCNIIIAWSFFPTVRREIGLQFRKSPQPLLMFMKFGERFQEFFAEEVDSLHKVCNNKVKPSDSSCKPFFISQYSIKFFQIYFPSLDSLTHCFLKCLFILVFAIDKSNEIWMKIFVDSMNCCHPNLFLCISAKKFRFITF